MTSLGFFCSASMARIMSALTSSEVNIRRTCSTGRLGLTGFSFQRSIQFSRATRCHSVMSGKRSSMFFSTNSAYVRSMKPLGSGMSRASAICSCSSLIFSITSNLLDVLVHALITDALGSHRPDLFVREPVVGHEVQTVVRVQEVVLLVLAEILHLFLLGQCLLCSLPRIARRSLRLTTGTLQNLQTNGCLTFGVGHIPHSPGRYRH